MQYIQHQNLRIILCAAVLAIAPAACQRADTGPNVDTASTAAKPADEQTPPSLSTAPVDPKSPAGAVKADLEHWQCGSIRVDSRLVDGTMELLFSGQSQALQPAESANGMRYSNSEGTSFFRDGDSASLTLSDDEQYDCSPGTQASPWTEAAARGIAFRAVGNEPGWLVELEKADKPSLHALVDYGQRNIDVKRMRPVPNGMAGKTTDGTQVTLYVRRQSCQDDMSGERFQAEATLIVGEETYRGCGAFLHD